MDLAQTMAALKKAGNAQTKKTWLEHGATGELFGVKIADMKVIAKKIKGRQDLALELYATGNLDAMYLAGSSPMARRCRRSSSHSGSLRRAGT
jgi:hypothetical protein